MVDRSVVAVRPEFGRRAAPPAVKTEAEETCRDGHGQNDDGCSGDAQQDGERH